MHEADARIDSLVGRVGRQTQAVEGIAHRTERQRSPSADDPAYLGRDRIDCLGLTVSHAGTLSLGPHRLSRFIARIARRLDAIGPALSTSPSTSGRGTSSRPPTSCSMRRTRSPSPACPPILDTTTDRGSLKDLDFRIARKIVQVATRRPGVRGFRQLPPADALSGHGPGVARAPAQLAVIRASHPLLLCQARIPPSGGHSEGL